MKGILSPNFQHETRYEKATFISTCNSRPCDNFLADFCTSAILKVSNSIALTKSDGQVFRRPEVQNFAEEFSHGLNLSCS